MGRSPAAARASAATDSAASMEMKQEARPSRPSCRGGRIPIAARARPAGGEAVATDLSIKVLAQLLHRRGVLDLVEFAEELEVRALLLAKTDDGSEIAPAATLAAEVLDELARDLREAAPDLAPAEV
jgi:hypothetical protein